MKQQRIEELVESFICGNISDTKLVVQANGLSYFIDMLNNIEENHPQYVESFKRIFHDANFKFGFLSHIIK